MDTWLEFGRGHLFRLAYVLMLVGMLRIVLLAISSAAITALGKIPEPVPTAPSTRKEIIKHLSLVGRLWLHRPVRSVLTTIFHVGLILVPLFAASHVIQWKNTIGFSWWMLPNTITEKLTITVIVVGLLILAIKFMNSKKLIHVRWREIFWLILLIIPFATGFFFIHQDLSPKTYQILMIIHVYSANLVILSLPFTRIAQCILHPLTQVLWALTFLVVNPLRRFLGHQGQEV